MSILIFDKEMLSFLEFAQKNTIIAVLLLQGSHSHINEEGNFIKRDVNINDFITFLPKSKYEKVDDSWVDGRTKIKIGRFIRKFLTEFSIKNWNISDSDIEKFVNLYKSYFSNENTKFQVVEGDDIQKYYLEENYDDSFGNHGPLWNSCMRQPERNKFMKIYSLNPQKVKMLVLFSNNGKVRARALLWQEVNEYGTEETYKFMDRIYYICDYDVNTLKNWARENGYIYKFEQSAKTEMIFDKGDGIPMKKKLFVSLDNHVVKHYPYLDTFKFYKENLGRFSNSDSLNFDYILTQSNGSLEQINNDDDDYYDEF